VWWSTKKVGQPPHLNNSIWFLMDEEWFFICLEARSWPNTPLKKGADWTSTHILSWNEKHYKWKIETVNDRTCKDDDKLERVVQEAHKAKLDALIKDLQSLNATIPNMRYIDPVTLSRDMEWVLLLRSYL